MDLHWGLTKPSQAEIDRDANASALVNELVLNAPSYDYRPIVRLQELSREASGLGEFNVALAALTRRDNSDQEPMLVLWRALGAADMPTLAFLSDTSVPLTALLDGGGDNEPPPPPDMATVLRVEGMSMRVPSPDFVRLRDVLDDLRRQPRLAVIDLPSASVPQLPLGARDDNTGLVRVLEPTDGRVALLEPEEIDLAWSVELLEERQRFWHQTLRWWTAEWLFNTKHEVLGRLGYTERATRATAAAQALARQRDTLRALGTLLAGIDDDDEDQERKLAAIQPAELQAELRELNDTERTQMRRRLVASLPAAELASQQASKDLESVTLVRDLFVLRNLSPLLAQLQQRFEDGSMLLGDVAVSEFEVHYYALQYLELLAAGRAPEAEYRPLRRRRLAELARWLRFYEESLTRAQWEAAAQGRWSTETIDYAWNLYKDLVVVDTRRRERAPTLAHLKPAFVAILDGELHARLLAFNGDINDVRVLWERALGHLATGRLNDVLAETRRQASMLFWASRRRGTTARKLLRALYGGWSAITLPLREADARQLIIERYVEELKRLEPTVEVALDVVLELDSRRSVVCEAHVIYTETERALLWQDAAPLLEHRFTLWRSGRRVLEKDVVLRWPDVDVRTVVREPGLYWYDVERLRDGVVMAAGKSFVARVTGTQFCRRTQQRYDVREEEAAIEWRTTLLPPISALRLQDAPLSKTHRLERMASARLLARFLEALPEGGDDAVAIFRRGLAKTHPDVELRDEVNRALKRSSALFDVRTTSWWLLLTCMSRWRDFGDAGWTTKSRAPYALQALSDYATKSLESFQLLEDAYVDDCIEQKPTAAAALDVMETILHVRSLSLSKLKALSVHNVEHQQRVRAALQALGSCDVRIPRAQLELNSAALWRGRHSAVTLAPDAFSVVLELRLESDGLEFGEAELARTQPGDIVGRLSMLMHLRRGSVRIEDEADMQLVVRIEEAWQALLEAFHGGAADARRPDTASTLWIGDNIEMSKRTLALFEDALGPTRTTPRSLFDRVEVFEQMLQVRRQFELRSPSHERLDELVAAVSALEDHYVSVAREE